MAPSSDSSVVQQELPPSSHVAKGICEQCLLLHQNVASIVRDWRAGKTSIETNIKVERTDDLSQSCHACFLCARLWYLFRLAKHCLTGAELMTEAETLAYACGPDHQGSIGFNLEISRHSDDAFIANIWLITKGKEVGPCRFTIDCKKKAPEQGTSLRMWTPYPDGPFAEIQIGSRQVHEGDLTDYSPLSGSVGLSDQVFPLPKMRLVEIRRCLLNCDSRHECYVGDRLRTGGEHAESSRKAPGTSDGQLSTQLDAQLRISSGNEPRTGLPKRLLEVGNTGKVRLVHTDDLEDPGPVHYATLSHCWGTVTFNTLTRANLEDSKRDIPLDWLGKTFREAIELCRRLQIGYIWIDSWCIVQDSLDQSDWHAHVGQMREIYQLAYVNFAAGSSSSCHYGLLRPYQTNFHLTWKVEMDDMRFEWGRKGDGHMEQLLWRSSPLFKRGWVVQELYLAARVVFFTNAGVYFKCQRGLRPEPEYPDVDSSFRNIMPEMLIHGARRLVGPSSSTSDLDQAWARKVVDYSGSRLTRASDRTAAFTSLVSYFADLYSSLDPPSKYMAGGWDHDPALWINWQRVPSSAVPDLESRFAGYPSWSWLSYPGSVTLPLSEGVFHGTRPARDPEMEIVRVIDQITIPREASDPFGPFVVTQLRLKAPIFALTVHEGEWQPADTYNADAFADKPVQVSYSGVSRKCKLEGRMSRCLVLPVGNVFVDDEFLLTCFFNFDYQDRPDEDGKLECILLTEKSSFRSAEYRLLLVRRANTDSSDPLAEYRRVGILDIVEGQGIRDPSETWPCPPRVKGSGYDRRISAFFDSSRPSRREFKLQ